VACIILFDFIFVFINGQVLRDDGVMLKGTVNGREMLPFVPVERVSPWSRRRTLL